MNTTEMFLVLGIEPTRDERTIKNAYREKLTVTNPEDDPEGFKRLRKAYEEACVYAKTPDEEKKEQEKDTTASGLWLEKAKAIYQNIHSRQDEKLWDELFDEDAFLDLEEEENCRFKLLRFLMDHFRLPGHIWKVLDKRMNLVEDALKLRETFPADFIAYVVRNCEHGEELEFEFFEGEPEAEYDLFMNYYDDCWRALSEENLTEAERLLKEAEGLHIYHPAMEVCRGRLLNLQDKKEESMAFMRTLYEKHPGNVMVAYNTGEAFWCCDKKEEAAAYYLELKKDNDKHYVANLRLAEWYYEKGRYEEAKACAGIVISMGASDEFLELLVQINSHLEGDFEEKWNQARDLDAGFELGWCYLQDGKISKGVRLIKELEEQLTLEKKLEFQGLAAKLYFEQAEYKSAIRYAKIWEDLLKKQLPLDETDEAREKNKDRIRQARMIYVQCYRLMSYGSPGHPVQKEPLEKALKEIERIEKNNPEDIGLLLEKANIYKELEEYEKALEITDYLMDRYQVYAAAATAMEVYRKQWDAGGVVRFARLCIEKFPGFIRAYDQLAQVYSDLKETELLQELLETAGKNEVTSPYLEAYAYRLTEEVPEYDKNTFNEQIEAFFRDYAEPVYAGVMEKYKEGLELITKYMCQTPYQYTFRLRADYYLDGQEFEKALADCRAALLDEPGLAEAYEKMSEIYRLMGDYEQALINMKKAILYRKGPVEAIKLLSYPMARLYMLLGDDRQALEWLEFYDENSPQGTANHLRCMAECLARLGMINKAVDKLNEFARMDLKRSSTYFEQECKAYDGFYTRQFTEADYYKELSKLYRMAGRFQEGKQALYPWVEKMEAMEKKCSGIWAKISGKKPDGSYTDYCDCMAWLALVRGERDDALKYLDKQIRQAKEESGNYSDEGLEDMIFAAILYGEDAIGARHAGTLRTIMEQTKKESADEYFHSPKAALAREFLANYYEFSDEQLQAILDKEKDCAVCRFCLMPKCKELEAMRILLLIRQGKTDEAKARLEANQKVQPYDEYMQAIAAVLK